MSQVTIKAFPVQIPPDFTPTRIIDRKGKRCVCQDAPYKPLWGGGFLAKRGKFLHHAIDIMCAVGSRVVACDDGHAEVIWTYKGEHRPGVGTSPKGGNYVRIIHSWGVSYYAHLDQPSPIKPGQDVKAGELLGYAGDSGNALGGCPHLHYSMNHRGRMIDPLPHLKPLYEAGGWMAK